MRPWRSSNVSVSPLNATQIPPFPVGSAPLLQSRMPQPTAQPFAAGPGAASAAMPQEASSGSTQQLQQVSQEFEALLLSFVFKAMRQTVPKSDFLGKARDRDWYADLFDFELAKNFTHGKSLGLSAYLQQGLQPTPTRPAPHPHAGAPRPSPAWHAEPVTSADPRPPTAATEAESLSEAMILPMIGRLSSHYGERPDPLTGEGQFHHGIDIASPTGTEIHAALPGTVAFSG
jgi:murein DD-endopeptidase MepM/ murein hydrolase activator NlpD